MRNKIWIIAVAVLAAIGILVYVLVNPDGNGSAQGGSEASENTLSHGIVINEVMASNSDAVPDDDGDFSDWIELHNPTDKAVDLSAWALSDSPDEAKWPIPNGVVLEPGEYLVIYCSGKGRSDPAAPLHASFKIKAGEESAVLVDVGGRLVQQVPAIVVAEGMSLARTADGDYVEMKPSPGYENSQAGIQAYMDSRVIGESPLVIHEFQPNNQSTYPGEDNTYPDWVEIFNPGAAPIDISGYGLSDDVERPLKWRFPEGTAIQPGEYLLILVEGAGDLTALNSSQLQASFSLDSYAESVVLSDKLGARIDAVDYEDVPADTSYGLDAAGNWRVFVQPTPGFPNTEEGYQQYSTQIQQFAYQGGVYISEVMLANRSYAGLDDDGHYDWIELHNPGGEGVNLTGWGLSDNSGHPRKWRFPDGTTIGPGEYMMVYASNMDLPKKKFETDATGMMMAGAAEDASAQASYASATEEGAEDAAEAAARAEESSEGDPLSGALHANFSLSNIDGEIITLWNNDKQLVDRLACPPQLYESSAGRTEPGGPYRLFSTPSPGEANAGPNFSGRMDGPRFELPAGLYNGSQLVAVSYGGDGQLRYTTDGSRPTVNSPEWPGSLTVSQTTAVRVSAFDPSGQRLESQPATATYVIDSPHGPELSIVSVCINPEDMYDENTGIYVKGPNVSADAPFPYSGANFWQEWEKAANVEIFAPSGEGGQLQVSQETAFRIFGAYSRGMEQKGFAVVPRSIYGGKTIDYPLFTNRPYEDYHSITLRAGAQDSMMTKLHDVVATGLVDGTTNLEVQAYRQAVQYINGEYFGYYHIREKVNKYWVNQHYGYDPENIDLLVGNGTPLGGDRDAYDALIDYCKAHHLSNEEDYQYVASRMDIDNYIDYLICEMYVANTDSGNIKFFRERSTDPEKSKWRWIYYDFCWSFMESSIDMDTYAFLTNEAGHGAGKGFSTQLTRSLLQNQNFRNQFLRRFAELLNTVYAPENVLAKIEEVEAVLAPEKERDSERWPQGSVNGWNSHMEKMKDFASQRKDYCIGFLRKHFALNEADATRIFGSPGKMSDRWNESQSQETAEGQDSARGQS